MRFDAKIIAGGVAAGVTTAVAYMLLARGEKARFETVTREGAFSVRDYPRLTVVETVMDGLRGTALSLGFSKLADYLGAGRRLPIAVPMLADGAEDGRGWRTRFVLPSRIDPAALPEPEAGVSVRSLPARRIAAVRFAGQDDDAALAGHEDALRKWMRRQGLRAAGPVEHAFYHSPLTPPLLRRTEVMIPLAA